MRQRVKSGRIPVLQVFHTSPLSPALRRILDQQMADSLGIKGPSSNAFLTEPLDDTEVEAEKDEAPRKWSKMGGENGVPHLAPLNMVK